MKPILYEIVGLLKAILAELQVMTELLQRHLQAHEVAQLKDWYDED
jgi:hypothetical protein